MRVIDQTDVSLIRPR